MPKPVRISLANKCQLLFGAAVVLILFAALAVVWARLQTLTDYGPRVRARDIANAWLADMIQLGAALHRADHIPTSAPSGQGLSLTLIHKDEFDLVAQRDPFISEAIERFQTRGDRQEQFASSQDSTGKTYYRFVRAVRKSDLSRIAGGLPAGFVPTIESPTMADPLEMVLLVQLRDAEVQQQLALNRIYIVAAGLFAGLLAIAAFWFITTRIILSPVRVLRDTAAKIAEGNLNTRSDINTGDEFEQLSDTFNQMLERLKQHQDQLTAANKSLDLKLGELAQTNVSLFEANKIKGEFLANVSHELRTPLNSITGFAEVLQETLKDRTGPVDEKRKRYASNIITSSRHLLDLINDLLDLAKIEAGRMDVRLAPMSVTDVTEGLLNLMRPQAEKRQIELRLKVEPNLPPVHTDAGKVQQVLFNFLSNAIKFTPDQGVVTLTAALLPANPDGKNSDAQPRIRLSVTDNGPGIPPDQHERIFEKFTQLDPTVTKQHQGTGLGLAISKELARVLHGKIELESQVGQGATFSLIIPLAMENRIAPLMPDNPPAAAPVRPSPSA